jgi:TonB family protein
MPHTRDAKLASTGTKVTLLAQLDESGKFASIVVESSSGSPSLDAASISALKQWRCSPVIENGRAVAALVKQEFHFKME